MQYKYIFKQQSYFIVFNFTESRDRVEISKQQYGFMPGKGTTDAMFALRMLMEKYREDQRELHCVFMDLEKAYNRVSREAVVLHEKIRNSGKVCATSTEYV